MTKSSPQHKETDKIVLFIDGSNLYGGMTELLSPGQYFEFPELLAAIEKDFTLSEVNFYGTYMQIDPDKSASHRLRVQAQKAFFDSAKNCPRVSFFKGHFSGTGKEKGIDVRLAVDMAVGASEELYDQAIIMTGDADLKYGVEVANHFKRTVHLAAFGSRFPFGIAPLTKKRYVYDFDGFFEKSVRPTYKRVPKSLIVHELKDEVMVKSIAES